MRKLIFKVLVLIIIFSISQLGVSMSYFSDTATILGNTLTTSSLEVGMRSGQGNFVSDPLDLELGDSVARDIYTQKLGSLDFKYRSKYEYVSGDTELCDALQLRVWYNWYDAPPPSPGDHSTRHMDLKYNGSLSSFDNFDTSEPTHDPDMQLLNTKTYYSNIFYADNEHWFYYQVSLPSDASSTLRNKTCTFNIRTTGWQTNFDDETKGFFDSEKIESTISTASWANAGNVVINEVYYDVCNKDDGSCGDYKGKEGKNEWVELYNNTDQDISLKGWSLTNNTGTKTIMANKIIKAYDFIVISHDTQTCGKHWDCDPNRHINLGGSPGTGWLNNNGDQLTLKDSVNKETDFVAWEKGYDDICPDWDITANKGQSIAREEKGVDTDSVKDWKNLVSPNPGTNPHPSGTVSELEPEVEVDEEAETGEVVVEEFVADEETEGAVETDLEEPELPEQEEQEIEEEEQTEEQGGELEDNEILDEQEVAPDNPDEGNDEVQDEKQEISEEIETEVDDEKV